MLVVWNYRFVIKYFFILPHKIIFRSYTIYLLCFDGLLWFILGKIINPKNNLTLAVSEKGLGFHLTAIVSSVLTAICLGWYFENYSDATSPYLMH